jgi:hypothetical protein
MQKLHLMMGVGIMAVFALAGAMQEYEDLKVLVA